MLPFRYNLFLFYEKSRGYNERVMKTFTKSSFKKGEQMKKKGFWYHFNKNKMLLLMALPGALWLIFFFYIPVLGNVVAFKNFTYSDGGFFKSLQESPWVGFDNFKFLFSSSNAYIITRNTVLYNVVFIIILRIRIAPSCIPYVNSSFFANNLPLPTSHSSNYSF